MISPVNIRRWQARSDVTAVARIVAAAIIALNAAVILPRQAAAHGGGPGFGYDPCAQWAGLDNYVHFAAYQPELNRFTEYCGNVPRAGPTLLVFDLVGNDLTSAPVALEIVDEGGARLLRLPARHYPAGVIDVRTELASGEYTALLTIGQVPIVYRVHFDLAVGAWWYPLIMPLIVATLVLLAAGVYCLFQARSLTGEMLSTASPGYRPN